MSAAPKARRPSRAVRTARRLVNLRDRIFDARQLVRSERTPFDLIHEDGIVRLRAYRPLMRRFLGAADEGVAKEALKAFKKQGLLFTRFHVSPTCAPCRSALMSGRHEFKNGVTHTILERERLTLSATTIAQVLQSAGYSTGIFGKWHLGSTREMRPNNQGFDESLFMESGLYLPVNDPRSVNSKQDFDPIDKFLWPNMRFATSYNGGKWFEPDKYLADYYTDEAVNKKLMAALAADLEGHLVAVHLVGVGRAGGSRWRSRIIALPDRGSLQTQQSADQTADNLSVSNAVNSLRAIGDALQVRFEGSREVEVLVQGQWPKDRKSVV